MAVPVRAAEKSATTGDSGELREMHLHKSCGYAHCEELGIASLGDEDLCCDHFVLRSYEFLQRMAAERPGSNGNVCESVALKNTLNNCLQGALEASLRSTSLNNLQKARLLDIMLWAGEYVRRFEPQSIAGPNLRDEFATQGVSKRPEYQKPQVKTRTTPLPQ